VVCIMLKLSEVLSLSEKISAKIPEISIKMIASDDFEMGEIYIIDWLSYPSVEEQIKHKLLPMIGPIKKYKQYIRFVVKLGVVGDTEVAGRENTLNFEGIDHTNVKASFQFNEELTVKMLQNGFIRLANKTETSKAKLLGL